MTTELKFVVHLGPLTADPLLTWEYIILAAARNFQIVHLVKIVYLLAAATAT